MVSLIGVQILEALLSREVATLESWHRTRKCQVHPFTFGNYVCFLTGINVVSKKKIAETPSLPRHAITPQQVLRV